MNARNVSLDVFRGAAVALMILVNNPGTWSHLYPPLAHAPWHGCTPTDLVFPFFLFAVGNALAFVMPGLLAGAQAELWAKVARRTLLIFAIGLALNHAPFVRWDAEGGLVLKSLETLRTMGVLQRIALCWGAAAVLVWAVERRGVRAIVVVVAALLLGYWWACLALGAQSDPYSLQGWFGNAVDRMLLGEAHLYKGEGRPFDPEGLASTAPAIAQVLLGYLAGRYVKERPANSELVARLFIAAAMALLLAYLWQLEFPLNKKIWTSSYVLHTTGLALATLALLVWRIEVQRKREAWTFFFEVFGKNALFVFVLSGLVPRCLALVRWSDGVDAEGTPRWLSPLPWLYRSAFADIGSDPRLGSFLFSVANLALYWALAAGLDRRRIYIRV